MRQNSTRLISVADILEYIIPRCYFLVVGLTVGALLFAAYTYIADKKAIAQDAADYGVDVSSFSEEELTEVQNAIAAKKTLDDLQAYYDRSYIYKIDPLAVNSVSLYYKVDLKMEQFPEEKAGQEGTYINNIRNEYTQYVTKSALASDVADILGVDAECIAELIYAENDGNDKLVIVIRAVDQIDGVVDAVQTAFANKEADVTNNYVPHTYALYDSFESTVRVDDFYNKQKVVSSEINNCTNNINSAVSKLDTHQLAYYNEQTGDERLYMDPDTGKEVERYVAKSSKDFVKNAIFGAIAGVMVAAIGLICTLAYSKKIVCMSDYKVSIGVNVIENIKDKNIAGRVVMLVASQCKKNNITDICFVTSIAGLCDDENVKMIMHDLEHDDIKVMTIDDIAGNNKSLQDMLNAGAVVLIEKKGKSLYKDVAKVVEVCEESDISLLGVVNLV